MASFSVSKEIKSNSKLSYESVISSFEKLLPDYFDKIKTTEENDKKVFSGQKKTAFFNPIVSLEGTTTVKTGEDFTTVMIRAQTKTNGWFWFTGFIGIFFPILWAVMIGLWFYQSNECKSALQMTLDQMALDLT